MQDNRIVTPAKVQASSVKRANGTETPQSRKIDCGSKDGEAHSTSITRTSRGPGVRRDG
jgi:hypothetical protein